MPIVVVGNVFVDFKGFPEGTYLPAGRNAGRVEIVHGGVGRNVAEDIANAGMPTRFVSMVDNTAQGAEVLRNLQNRRVDTKYVSVVPDGMGIWLADGPHRRCGGLHLQTAEDGRDAQAAGRAGGRHLCRCGQRRCRDRYR